MSTMIEPDVADLEAIASELTALQASRAALLERIATQDGIAASLRERAISGTVDAAELGAAQAALDGFTGSLATLDARIASATRTLQEQRAETERIALQARAVELANEATAALIAMYEGRKAAARALLEHPAAAEWVRLRKEAWETQTAALESLRDACDGDRKRALKLLTEHDCDARALRTPVYPAPRFIDRRHGAEWRLPVPPLWKTYPPLEGGEILDLVAISVEFGVLLPPDGALQLGIGE